MHLIFSVRELSVKTVESFNIFSREKDGNSFSEAMNLPEEILAFKVLFRSSCITRLHYFVYAIRTFVEHE